MKKGTIKMDITNAQRARILVHALPYIQDYSGKIVVIKYGGNAMVNVDLKDSVMRDIILLSCIGVKVVLVHGGGPEITEMLGKLGIESKFVDGLRVTDDETAKVVQMVLAGKVNKDLVNLIENKGGKAIGLSGIDGHMLEATPKDKRLGRVGEITNVNIRPITDVLEKVLCPPRGTGKCRRRSRNDCGIARRGSAHLDDRCKRNYERQKRSVDPYSGYKNKRGSLSCRKRSDCRRNDT